MRLSQASPGRRGPSRCVRLRHCFEAQGTQAESSDGLRETLQATLEAVNSWEAEQKRWIETGVCPDPGFWFSMDSAWLEAERNSWATRQRTRHGPEDAVHFLLDGRDGYVEILASAFTWQAWHQGHPRLNEVSGEPIMTGQCADGPRH